jgi:type II secretory pathway component PulF
MSTWIYKAVAVSHPGMDAGAPTTGTIASDSPANARAALRRLGLQVLDLRRAPERWSHRTWRLGPLGDWARSHLRSRRGHAKADALDGLATLLESGVPLADALEALLKRPSTEASARHARPRVWRTRTESMLGSVRDAVRSGSPFSDPLAPGPGPGWFDQAELAKIGAGQLAGALPRVLRSLADRRYRSNELSGRIAGVLLYPAVVLAVGVGVTIFLSTSTLPQLVRVLSEARIEVPPLTLGVVATGQAMWAACCWAPLVLIAAILILAALHSAARRLKVSLTLPLWMLPRVAKDSMLAAMALGLAELIRCGVPTVDALRALAPSLEGLGARRLRAVLEAAASRMEDGVSVADAMSDPRWFNPEFRSMLAVGEGAGELDTLLERLGQRLERATRRRVDRLASLLEPAVVLALALLVGLVVVGAVLPLTRLQRMV